MTAKLSLGPRAAASPASVDDFIMSAGKPPFTALEIQQPWLGLDNAKATPVGNVSLSDAYKAKLKFIVDNAPGARSSASFMRGAVESAIDAKLAELLPK